MKDYTLKSLIPALALLALIPIPGVAATQENTVVAKGDGIEVNMAFVKKMEQYYLEKFHQHAEKPELIRSAVEHWLFVTEALQHGLDQKMSEEVPPDPGQMTAQTVHILHKLYVAHLLDQKHVPDDVLHTYYKVFPEKFTRQSSPAANQEQKNNETNATKESEELVPFADVKSQIRKILLQKMFHQVRREAFSDLKDKYNIQIDK